MLKGKDIFIGKKKRETSLFMDQATMSICLEIKTTVLPSNSPEQTKSLHYGVPNTATGMRCTVRRSRALGTLGRVDTLLPRCRPWRLSHGGNCAPTSVRANRRLGTSILWSYRLNANVMRRLSHCIPRGASRRLLPVLMCIVGSNAGRD